MTVIQFFTVCPRQEQTGCSSFRRFPLSEFFPCACHIRKLTDKKRNLYQFLYFLIAFILAFHCKSVNRIPAMLYSTTRKTTSKIPLSFPYLKLHGFDLSHFVGQHTHFIIQRNASHNDIHFFRFGRKQRFQFLDRDDSFVNQPQYLIQNQE